MRKAPYVLGVSVGVIVGVFIDRSILASYWFPEVVWGNVADWVGGVGTAAAVGLGVYQLMRDRQERAADEDRLRDSLARAVLVEDVHAVKVAGGYRVKFAVVNGAQLPVFEAQAKVRAGVAERNVRIGTLAGTRRIDAETSIFPGVMVSEDLIEIELRFVDAYGSVWISVRGQVLESKLA